MHRLPLSAATKDPRRARAEPSKELYVTVIPAPKWLSVLVPVAGTQRVPRRRGEPLNGAGPPLCSPGWGRCDLRARCALAQFPGFTTRRRQAGARDRGMPPVPLATGPAVLAGPCHLHQGGPRASEDLRRAVETCTPGKRQQQRGRRGLGGTRPRPPELVIGPPCGLLLTPGGPWRPAPVLPQLSPFAPRRPPLQVPGPSRLTRTPRAFGFVWEFFCVSRPSDCPTCGREGPRLLWPPPDGGHIRVQQRCLTASRTPRPPEGVTL